MDSAAPVGAAEFAALMAPLGPFDTDRRVVAAVSGGADSMALAWLLARWGNPVAAIVDHGLRPEAASEAAQTVDRLAGFGIAATILRAGLHPGPSAAARARAARYRLLLQACRQTGRADLLLAHHAADQAETVRMRQDAGSAASGLAGMTAVAYRAEARLLRPLLPLPPSRLRATLRQAGVDWFEDPTNRDPASLRARLRSCMDAVALAESLDTARRSRVERQATEGLIAAELARISLSPLGFGLIPESLGPAALSALIWTLSGNIHPPPRATLAAGLASRTSHGVLFRPAGRLGSGTLATREPSAVAADVRATEGNVWDGRFRLGATLEGMTLGALGQDSLAFKGLMGLPSVVLQALPALRRHGRVEIVPHLAFPDARTCRSVPIWFAPSRPAAGAAFH